MARTVSTKAGDTVDQLAFQAYGFTDGATEAVFAANPQLAQLDPVLAAGLVITLPDVTPPPASPTVQLWD
jgi:phage tail protein X